jgi:hypothetical protein
MRAGVVAVRRVVRAWWVGGRSRGWARRGVGAGLVVVLVLTVAPASTFSAHAGWGNPLSGLGSWLGGIRDLVTGGGDEPVRHGALRPGPEWAPPGRAGTTEVGLPAKPPGKRVKELTDRRSATTSVFQLDDGRLQAEVSAVPVHWRDSSGRWRDVDTRIVPVASGSDGFVFGNDGTGFATRFGRRSDALVQVRLGGRWVRVGVTGPARRLTPTVTGSSVRYAGVWPGVDVVYDLTSSGLKESIIVSAPPAGDPSYEFTVQTRGLDTRSAADGSVGFFATGGNSSGSPVFAIPKPFMVDARPGAGSLRGSYSDAVGMVLAGSGAARSVTIRPDRAWLAAADRVYPVVVDPTVTVQPDASTSQDAMVDSSQPTANFGSVGLLGVGAGTGRILRGLVRFDLAGVVPTGTTVDSALLQLYWDNQMLPGTTLNPIDAEARAVTQAWDESTVTWNSINTAISPRVGFVQLDANTPNSSTPISVGGVVREWLAGTRPNNGFAVKVVNESLAQGGLFFRSGDFPVSAVGEWPNQTTRIAPKLTLTFGLPGVVVDDPQVVRSTGAQLSWSAVPNGSGTADDPVEVQVHRSTQANFAPSAATLLASLPGGASPARAYTDTTAPPDTAVYYQVVVRRADGQLGPVTAQSGEDPTGRLCGRQPAAGRGYHPVGMLSRPGR